MLAKCVYNNPIQGKAKRFIDVCTGIYIYINRYFLDETINVHSIIIECINYTRYRPWFIREISFDDDLGNSSM